MRTLPSGLGRDSEAHLRARAEDDIFAVRPEQGCDRWTSGSADTVARSGAGGVGRGKDEREGQIYSVQKQRART